MSLIAKCLNSIYFNLLLNGCVVGGFKPDRGLRQGDPLSPFLFIIFSELISRILMRASREGLIHEVKIGRSGLSIDHLLFIDDVLIFCRVNENEVRALIGCLNSYCEWFGQLVNFSKSGVFFSKNTCKGQRRAIERILNLKSFKSNAFYLGNPLFLGRSKIKSFSFLKEKVESRLASWQGNLLSLARKLTLVKSVLNALPLYTMSSIIVPSFVCQLLDSLTRKFLGKSFLVSWDVICRPRSLGDLSIRKFEVMNRALVEKLGWCLTYGVDRLWTRALKAKYFPTCNFLNVSTQVKGSWV